MPILARPRRRFADFSYVATAALSGRGAAEGSGTHTRPRLREHMRILARSRRRFASFLMWWPLPSAVAVPLPVSGTHKTAN